MRQTDGTGWVRAALIALSVPLLAACGTAASPPGDTSPIPEPTAALTPSPTMPRLSSRERPAPQIENSTPSPDAAPSPPESTLVPVQAPPAIAEPGPAPASTSTPMATGWRTDPPLGGAVGEAAANTQVTLADGTRVSLEELAGGKPLLLYFFATW